MKQRGLPSDSGSHKRDSSSEAYGVTELSAARQGWVSDETQCSNTHCFTCSFPGHARRLSQGELSGSRGEPGFSVHRFPDAPAFEPPSSIPLVLTPSVLHTRSFIPPFSWFSKL